jgi:hypothetical protein
MKYDKIELNLILDLKKKKSTELSKSILMYNQKKTYNI